MAEKSGSERPLRAGDVIFLSVPEAAAGERLDVWLAAELEASAARARIQKWIKLGCVTRGDESVSASLRIRAGEEYRIAPPAPIEPNLAPVAMDFAVLFEDEHLAVIHKPPGLAVHPGPGDGGHTLVNGLIFRWGELARTGGVRPGIVHRLDKDTEGLMIVAKQEQALRLLSRQFQERAIHKEYLAYLLATPTAPSGTVEAPIARNRTDRKKMRIHPGGRSATTQYVIEETFASRRGRKYARARLMPLTGRTHQLRVHMASLGCSIVGDPLYSRSRAALTGFGLLLLAQALTFEHPASGEPMSFRLELPDRFRAFEARAMTL